MDSDNSEDNLGLRNSSPRQSNSRNSSSLFGLWPKRSTKVEPHPVIDSISSDSHIGNNINKTDMSFAKCSPQKRTKHQQQLQQKIDSTDKHNELHNNINKNLNTSTNNVVSFRKTPNKNNNNNNRFSHQFSLCCKVDRKQSTPPIAVSVRYNSTPDIITAREKLLLNLTEQTAPIAEVSECNSAPETPVNNKSQSFNSHSSPSTNSVQSTRSTDSQQQQQSYQQMQHLQLPRSIAMSACRSRLRLKLLPPGKSIVGGDGEDLGIEINNVNNRNDKYDNNDDDYGPGGDGLRDKYNMSSPNLPIQKEFGSELQNNYRSMSQEGIQVIKRQSGSTDLARQALMAAQVLSLIPTEKARERNYLANRLACSSLLGATELLRVLPTRELSIFVGTWNMNGQSPPKQMNDFVLPASVEHVPDLIAIGTQESCSERYDWEVTLQETIGPSHVLFHSANLGTLHLAVFLRRDLIWFCSVPEDASMSVRPGTAFRTKGAVAISFCLFGTSMLFVTSHLTAHQQKVKERVQDVKRITHSLDLPRNLNMRHKNKDVTQNFDSVFWCGDLNFRLAEPRERLLEWIEKTKFPLPAHLPHGYMHTDQLSSVLLDGAAFKGFMEANITFPPTYKYDPGTQQFDTSSKQRAPAYTDRILFKHRMSNNALRRASAISGAFLSTPNIPTLECLAYDSVPSIISSDHKPVWALFRNSIKPGVDSIPLAAGLFMREVYVEGMRRRLNNNYSGSSAVCSIQ